MKTYIVKECNNYNDFRREWDKKYVIYRKRWYGLSWQAQTDNYTELLKMVNNILKQGDYVINHWTLTEKVC